MDRLKNGTRLIVLLFALSLTQAAYAQHAGMSVTKSGKINEDVYTAGGTVQILADVTGDVVAAGGSVTVVESVSGDVLSAGGTVTISADVDDDIRAAGGSVSVGGKVGGDAVIAGGSVTLGSASRVAGRAWLAGGTVIVDGTVGQELKAAGGEVVISSTVDGDAEIYAESVVIKPGAVITGNLNYMSPEQAVIAQSARIDGEINWRKLEFEHRYMTTGFGAGASVLFYLALAISAIVLSLIYPRFVATAVQRVKSSPVESFFFGIIVLIITPFIGALLMATLLGMPLGFIVLAMYFVMLILGFLMVPVWVGDAGFRMLGMNPEGAKFTRALSILVAAALLFAVGLLPFVGALLIFIAWMLGIGASARQFHAKRA